tara:strand:- start:293 stop:595 length:303 start_codon:yes stop_codon:yes gene_type:complete
MKKLIVLIIFPFLIIPFETKANENFSVEIEALTLVMEQYKKDSEANIDLDSNNKKPSYLALKQDECNATVKVTETTGVEVVNTESFDVNVCKKEIYKVIN